MRQVVEGMEEIWRSGDYIGPDRRPVARATIQHPDMRLYNYALRSTFRELPPSESGIADVMQGSYLDPFHGERVDETYADYLFSAKHAPKELPNIKSVQWTRSLDADVASCTIELWNSAPLQVGETPLPEELDHPGWFTYNRGEAAFASRWKHRRNEWFGMLMPDNIIRTFEGYGFDAGKAPEKDPNLMPTGVWMIDTVTMNADGTLTVACRDLGRLLLDQMCYAPVTPHQFYPLQFQNWDEKVFIGYTEPHRARIPVKAITSSNAPWGTDSVAGHHVRHAFDGDPSTYWLSVGNVHPSKRFAYEFVEGSCGGATVSEVRFKTRKAGYTAYIACLVDGVWQGQTLIDYHEDGIGRNGGNTMYVKSTHVSSEGEQVITFPAIKNVDRIRVVLGNLQNFGFGIYPYRAGIREVEVYGLVGTVKPKYTNLKVGPAGANPGRYSDYTDIVKLLCAWGGFYWPKGGYVKTSDGGQFTCSPSKGDPSVLGNGIRGRVWGDFMQSGTNGPAQITADTFDKKPLMDGISAIRDILGFVFFIDETGGVQWRMPNIFDRGNWVTNSTKPGRTSTMYAIDEKQILMSLEASIDSKNVREGIFVGNPLGKAAALVPGYNPNPTGLRRVWGWTDQNFTSTAESELMGEMVALRQLFSYRNDTITVPGFPGLQIDDQVRIYERVTSEGFIHYIKGISSTLDMEQGTYTYQLQTHWLGNDPTTKWVFNPGVMTRPARDYVKAMMNTSPGLISRPERPL